MENYMKMEVPARSENESFVRNAVAAFALPLNPTLGELSDVKTAVSEAVTNCIVHAYPGGAGAIFVSCTLAGKQLHIAVEDKGRGIENVEEAMQPFFTTLPGEERSGMGFTIMQTFMTSFSVESKKGGGTKVYMTKTFQPKPEEDA